MRISFAITLLLVGTWCLVGVQPQCQGPITSVFETYYMRIMRIGEDNYEESDEGTLSYDGIGKRFAFVTDPRSFSRRVLKEYICKDLTKSTGHKSVAILLNGQCEERIGYFFDLLVPTEDNYKGSIVTGGPGDELLESIYYGESTRERNDVILTTSKCGPVEIAFSDHEHDLHIRIDFYNLTASLPYDAFKISCPGQPDVECAAYVNF